MKRLLLPVLCLLLAVPALAKTPDAATNARCYAVSEELPVRHDAGRKAYMRDSSYKPTPAQRLEDQKEADRLNVMWNVLLGLSDYFMQVPVPPDVQKAVSAMSDDDLMKEANVCFAAVEE